MMRSNEKFSMIALDLPGRVLPSPSAGRLEVADLLQLAGKARHFGHDEVETPAPGDETAVSAFIPTLRRRRR
jgi:hypothetical protein